MVDETNEARGGLDEQERLAAEAAERDRVAAESLTGGDTPPPDTERIDEMRDGRGRVQRVLHGSGAPGEPETAEQGAVRTGRALPEHPADRDSAGLTVEETDAREAHTREQRGETFGALEAEGLAADGDVPGGVREEPRL